MLATCSSLFRILLRRGPAAIKRRLETKKTFRRLTAASVELQSNPEQVVVAAVVGGVVGDNIIAARFLRDLGAACPNVRLDIYTSNVALGEWIYAGVPGKRNCFQDSVFGKLPVNYDAEIEFGDTVRLLGAKPSILSNDHDPLSKIITSISDFSKLQEKNTTAYNPDGVIAQELLYTHGAQRPRRPSALYRCQIGSKWKIKMLCKGAYDTNGHRRHTKCEEIITIGLCGRKKT
jgi:hypothetical protein